MKKILSMLLCLMLLASAAMAETVLDGGDPSSSCEVGAQRKAHAPLR